jgi:hypothetical protein
MFVGFGLAGGFLGVLDFFVSVVEQIGICDVLWLPVDMDGHVHGAVDVEIALEVF